MICLFAGAYRGPSRGIISTLPKMRSVHLKPTSAGGSIAAILDGLDGSELERLACDVIREQRRRLEEAQNLYDRLGSNAVCGADDAGPDEVWHDYRFALLMMKAHHQIVSAVLDELGYVPQVSAIERHH
ncbi:transcriptional repressor TraM [Jiella pacifica]|uniref:Uncharacterized protein n=1 Tax=Jiella pacifica TaxID=2696469 RepID=A0A6N9T8D9_9HYPH|nr:transcriptional repressor TraM [Jiella pacifica]NDW07697.1 hypothetical protein [Jiella pacifica]